MRRSIRNLRSDKPTPPRFCDVIIENGEIYLETKNKNKYERILWKDVVHQVELAKSENL